MGRCRSRALDAELGRVATLTMPPCQRNEREAQVQDRLLVDANPLVTDGAEAEHARRAHEVRDVQHAVRVQPRHQVELRLGLRLELSGVAGVLGGRAGLQLGLGAERVRGARERDDAGRRGLTAERRLRHGFRGARVQRSGCGRLQDLVLWCYRFSQPLASLRMQLLVLPPWNNFRRRANPATACHGSRQAGRVRLAALRAT